jgi:hypothetical protein
MHVLKCLRNGPLTPAERCRAAGALEELMVHGSSVDLRLQAALALGEFTISAVSSVRLDLRPSNPRSSLTCAIPPSHHWSALGLRLSASTSCAS